VAAATFLLFSASLEVLCRRELHRRRHHRLSERAAAGRCVWPMRAESMHGRADARDWRRTRLSCGLPRGQGAMCARRHACLACSGGAQPPHTPSSHPLHTFTLAVSTWEAGQRSGVRNSKEIVGPIGNPGLDLDSDDWRWAHPRAHSAEQRRLEAIALAGLECRRTHAAERVARSHH